MPNTKVVDATGLFCPGPTQILKAVARKVEKGTVIELLADDQDTKKQVSDWCEESENTLLSVKEQDNTLHIFVEIK